MTDVGMVLDRVDKIADVIREQAAASERLGHLAPPVVQALRDADLFRVLVPTAFGGFGLTVPEAITVIERVAEQDASTGWTYAILAGSPIFARFLPTSTFAALFGADPKLAAGSLNPVATRVEAVDGGYRFTGRGTYLSGSAHAQMIAVAGIVFAGDQPVVADGLIHIRVGLMPIDQARSLDTWHVTGMRATGSNDYEFTDVHIDTDYTFEPFRPREVIPGDVFSAIPIWAQLGGTLAACAVGTARNMIDRFLDLAATKVPAGGNFTSLAERAPAQISVGEAEGLYQAARAVLHDTVRGVWARGEASEPFTNEVLAKQRVGIVTAVRLAALAIDGLHDAAGMNAVASDSVLDRCWRDVHTMTQHIILSPARYEIAGRVLLGLEPGAPVI
jgi:alkylation response protein AidB-like acyl-CoA dehydrogenase